MAHDLDLPPTQDASHHQDWYIFGRESFYCFSHNHGSGKWMKKAIFERDPFFTEP